MPELPEVETMVQWLKANVKMDKEIVGAKVLRGKHYLTEADRQAVRGNVLRDIRRVGKYIVFDLNYAKIVAHNAMSGYWDTESNPWCFNYVEGKRQASNTDVRATLGLSDFTIIRFHDARMFGSMKYFADQKGYSSDTVDDAELLDEEIPCLAKLGPDAMLETKACIEAFVLERFKHPKRMVKDALMDQEVLAGCGNIYASEALFQARISPGRELGLLSDFEVKNVVEQLGVIFRRALREELDYTKYLNIYRQKKCPICEQSVAMAKIKGRSSYFCPDCQE
ncbi:MAG: Fpg/Nei family DNA glycosylase [Acidiferrobacterales bacterium]